MTSRELPLQAVHRLIKKGGAERVEDDAARELRSTLEEISGRIATKAIGLASHAKRKTIKAADVRLALTDIIHE